MGATHNILSFWVIFCPFTRLLAPKIKNWKKIRRYFLFCMCTTNKDSWDITFNRQKFLSFLVIFIPLTNKKIKILRKKAWRYHQLILVYRKWQSYDVWFLSYKVQLTEFFVDYFLPFWPPLKTWKIKILKNEKKISWRYHHLYHKCIHENHMMYGSWDI